MDQVRLISDWLRKILVRADFFSVALRDVGEGMMQTTSLNFLAPCFVHHPFPNTTE